MLKLWENPMLSIEDRLEAASGEIDRLHEQIAAARNAIDVNVRGWFPIETAPHDGTVIELLGENGKFDIGEWHEWSEHFDKTANEIAEGVTGEFSTEYGEGPHTHWRPLTHNARNNRLPEGSPVD